MAVDMFLKLTGIEGESIDAKHKGEIDVESFSWGASNSGSAAHGGGAGAGKVSMQDFHFVMRTNRASPKLFLACASGEHIRTAQLTARKAGKDQQEFLKVTFEDILISSFKQEGTEAADTTVPLENVSFNFSKITFDYVPQKPDGSLDTAVTAGWDVQKNVKL